MYCKNCRRMVSEQDEICPHCGANLLVSYDRIKLFGIALEIFALVFAFIFFINSFINIMNAFEVLEDITTYSEGRDSFFFILLVLSSIVGLWMVSVLYLIAFRRTPENTPILTFKLIFVGIVLTALRIPLAFFVLDKYWSSILITPLTSGMSVLICVVGIYFLLYMMKQAPKFKTLFSDTSSKLPEILPSFILKLLGKQKPNEVHITSTDDQSTSDEVTTNDDNTRSFKQPINTKRRLLVYLLLNTISFGIYGWFYIHSLASDVNIMCKDDEKKLISIFPYILLNFVTCGIYSLYLVYCSANRLASNAPRYGLEFKEKGITVLLCYLAGYLVCFIAFYIKEALEYVSVFGFDYSEVFLIYPYVILFYLFYALYLITHGSWTFFWALSIIHSISSSLGMHILIKNTNFLAKAYNRSSDQET